MGGKPIHSLYDFQRDPVEDALAKGAGIFNWDTGLGKTYAAGAWMQELGGRSLVVCPAGVVARWHEFLAETQLSGVDVIADSQLDKARGSYDQLVVDELHRFKTWSALRTRTLRGLRKNVRRALGLTATLIPNDPGDVYEQCSIVRPGCFGSIWSFREQYQQKVPDEHAHSGYRWEGVSEEGGPALARKLARLVSRVTKSDVAHLLTPLNLHVVDRAEMTTKHAVTLTHNRVRAQELADNRTPYCITGAMTPKKRAKVIAEWRASRMPLVATMHSITEGIDLTHANQVIFDQLYWRPATIIQVIGRFHRLNQKEPVDIYFVVRPGSIEERIANVLKRKFDAMQQTGNASSTDRAVLGSLDAFMDKSDEDVLMALMNSAPAEQSDSFLLPSFMDDDSDE